MIQSAHFQRTHCGIGKKRPPPPSACRLPSVLHSSCRARPGKAAVFLPTYNQCAHCRIEKERTPISKHLLSDPAFCAAVAGQGPAKRPFPAHLFSAPALPHRKKAVPGLQVPAVKPSVLRSSCRAKLGKAAVLLSTYNQCAHCRIGKERCPISKCLPSNPAFCAAVAGQSPAKRPFF